MMAHIVLFHSILGLRPAERQIAKVLGSDGHTVVLPDLFDGRFVNGYESAFRMKEEIGDEAIMARARAAAEAAPDDAVFSGVSFGAFLVGNLWRDRPQMPGALLFAGIAPWMPPPRPGLKVSAHVARPDPFDDEDYFANWAAGAGETDLEFFRYDGAGHYFLDPSLPDYDAGAASLCLERSRAFLRNL